VGQRSEDFFVPSRAARLAAEDSEIMASGQGVMNREEVRFSERNEPRWFLCAKLPLFSESGEVTGLVSLSRDITHHKRTTEQLRQSQKMEAIGRLAGGIAHDFNNIMTAILGFSEIIISEAGENESLKRDVGHIFSGATRAAALTQQLLAFSRRQVTAPKPLSLNDVVTGMEPMMKRLIGEHIRFITRLDPRIGTVKADLNQMEQVIMNLVVNSRDAITDHGTICLETSRVELGPDSGVRGAEVTPGPYVRLVVKDDGCGIPKDLHERIFEPFFTTKEQGKGTGLGLATSYGIIQQSGGYISMESTEGQGTTFTIFLPALDAVPDLGSPVESGESVRGDEVILVVEDDPAVRELTTYLLTDLGYHVVAAEDGVDALDRLQDPAIPRPDLLLTDVKMPRMGGRELADNVRTLLPETKVLFTSGYNEEEVLHRGIATEEIWFLSKPFTAEALTRKVREVLAEQGVLELAGA
jgi:two-component system, cell cycle sensor histidine kinase and response regulator CckA